jgi:hypothetical protein
VYLDNGSGSFEPGSDALVASVSLLTLTGGVQSLPFVDGDPDAQAPFGTSKTYFVAVETTLDAASQTPNSFQVTHLTGTSSTGDDATYDIPLTLEGSANVSTGVIDTVLGASNCSAPYDLNLFDVIVSSALTCQAGTTLRAGPMFLVAPTGTLSFRAGERVVLGSGFQVQTGATFTVEIDPLLQPE